MKTFKSHLLAAAFAAAAMSGCGKQTFGGATVSTAPGQPLATDYTDELTRRCRVPIRYTDSSAHIAALESLVQAVVSKKETPTTMCVAAELSPIKNFNASFRVEYEDDYGLRWVTFRKESLIYSNQLAGQFRLLFLDKYGYVDLNTTISGSNTYTGTVRMANISQYNSYLSQINTFLNLIRTTCTESPAKCINPVFIQDPYAALPPTEAQILQRASDAFAGQYGADVRTLGTVTFDSSFIERTLF